MPLLIGYIIFFASMDSSGDPSSTGGLLFGLSWVAYLALIVWNLGYRQGTTGQSIGKSVLGIKVVDTVSGMPIGFGRGVLRALLNGIFNNACLRTRCGRCGTNTSRPGRTR